jgi:hypothetical protein
LARHKKNLDNKFNNFWLIARGGSYPCLFALYLSS